MARSAQVSWSLSVKRFTKGPAKGRGYQRLNRVLMDVIGLGTGHETVLERHYRVRHRTQERIRSRQHVGDLLIVSGAGGFKYKKINNLAKVYE